jgi:hypothetical protein
MNKLITDMRMIYDEESIRQNSKIPDSISEKITMYLGEEYLNSFTKRSETAVNIKNTNYYLEFSTLHHNCVTLRYNSKLRIPITKFAEFINNIQPTSTLYFHRKKYDDIRGNLLRIYNAMRDIDTYVIRHNKCLRTRIRNWINAR